MKTKIFITLTLLVAICGVQAAQAECYINGTVTAESNPDPMGPEWVYTMVVSWDTGNAFGLSHANLLLDIQGGTCLCQDFVAAISWDDPVGFSDGYPEGCMVYYQGFLECEGDPSIPGFSDILLKFEPIEGECEPGPTGTATWVFYSDLPPVPINEDILSVVDKHAQEFCTGNMSGDFPALQCDPVGNDYSTWGNLKGLFR